MRVLIQNNGDSRCSGMTNVLMAMGHDVVVWDAKSKPAFDVFDEIGPEIFLFTDMDRATKKCVDECGTKLKCVSLKNIPFAADTVSFSGGERREELASQIVCIDKYKPDVHNKYVLPLCHSFQIKIFGEDAAWPVGQYLGRVSPRTIPSLYASAMVSLNFSGPETAYQILASGGLPVSLKFESNVFNDENSVMFHNLDLLRDAIRVFTDRDQLKLRNKMTEVGRGVIYNGHTYWHRVALMFESLGIQDEARRTLVVYENTKI